MLFMENGVGDFGGPPLPPTPAFDRLVLKLKLTSNFVRARNTPLARTLRNLSMSIYCTRIPVPLLIQLSMLLHYGNGALLHRAGKKRSIKMIYNLPPRSGAWSCYFSVVRALSNSHFPHFCLRTYCSTVGTHIVRMFVRILHQKYSRQEDVGTRVSSSQPLPISTPDRPHHTHRNSSQRQNVRGKSLLAVKEHNFALTARQSAGSGTIVAAGNTACHGIGFTAAWRWVFTTRPHAVQADPIHMPERFRAAGLRVWRGFLFFTPTLRKSKQMENMCLASRYANRWWNAIAPRML